MSEHSSGEVPARAKRRTFTGAGVYLASESTFYRLLRSVHGDVRERRAQAVHPARVRPELIATKPNQAWSWDITKLHGLVKWTYFYLYVVMDVYSRKAVGWMVATRGTADLAEALLAETIAADNGTSMASKTVRCSWQTSVWSSPTPVPTSAMTTHSVRPSSRP